MKFRKSFKHALDMVLHSKLRSWLTILGIVIGVASVIAILSMGQGLQAEVDSRVGVLGNDLLTITAGASRAGGFQMRGPGEGGGGGTALDVEEE
ncbi:MAG: ABC transporter permease, partial [Candidatus Woesearchaeota archaeon]